MSTSIAVCLLLLSGSIQAFGTIPHQLSRTPSRTAARMPPLFYTDIEPEIRSATIPPVLHFNDTSVSIQSSESTTRARPYARKAGRPRTRSKIERRTKPPKSHVTTWQTRYKELAAYKEEHGHCLVPQNYSADRRLGLWVMQQRRQKTLKERGNNSSFDGPGGRKRVQLLEELGFVWRVERRGPRGAYGSLRRMKELAVTQGTGDDILDASNFEEYMIQKSEEYSDDDIRAAWRRRFEIFQ